MYRENRLRRTLPILALAALLGSGLAMGQRWTVEDGTEIDIRLLEKVSSETARSGDTFLASLDRALRSRGQVIAEEGSRVRGELVEVQESGRVSGVAVLAMTLREIEVDGRFYPVYTNRIEVRADPKRKKDAQVIGGGAGIGALIGAIAGGGKGALIGAAVGAGAGTAVVLTTDGDEVTFDAEQRFRFTLTEDFTSDAEPVRTRPEARTGREVENQANDLQRAARRVAERAEDLADDNFERWAGTWFVAQSFQNSVRILAEMADNREAADLSDVIAQVVKQYRDADDVIRRAVPDPDLFRDWETVGERLRELEDGTLKRWGR